MKKLIATALCSLVVLGLGAHQAHAFGCCKYNYRCCAAQYNAFSPFCCNTVMSKGLFCKKCFHVLDCPPACPQPWCPVDAADCQGNQAAGAVWMGGEQVPAPGMAGYQVPLPMPDANTTMMGTPYVMPNAMIHTAGYQPYPQNYGCPQNYGYPQNYPQMMQGYGAMMQNGVVPMNNVPWYWNGNVAPNGQ